MKANGVRPSSEKRIETHIQTRSASNLLYSYYKWCCKNGLGDTMQSRAVFVTKILFGDQCPKDMGARKDM